MCTILYQRTIDACLGPYLSSWISLTIENVNAMCVLAWSRITLDVAECSQELLELDTLKSDSKLQKPSMESSRSSIPRWVKEAEIATVEIVTLRSVQGSDIAAVSRKNIRCSHKTLCLCEAKMLSNPYTFLVIDFIVCSRSCFRSSLVMTVYNEQRVE